MNISTIEKGNVGVEFSQQETFTDLCKQLGSRISSTENALLCHRAYEVYLRQNPDTAHGKGNKSDRDQGIKSFRRAAAEASGVAAATIDALLQVGKAITPLPEQTKDVLTSCSLGNFMRGLRKLATDKFDGQREQIISDFAKQEAVDRKSARKNLMKTLGMVNESREETRAREVGSKSSELAEGEFLEIPFNGYLVRVEIGGQSGGRVHVSAVVYQGERKQVEQFLKSEAETKSSEQPAAPPVDLEAQAA